MADIVQRILKVFEKNNLFDEGVELIGSWAFLLYQKHLGVPKFPLRTQDIDFLIPNPFTGDLHQGFIDELIELGFKCEFRSDGSLFLYNTELLIEFITPQKGKGSHGAITIKKLGLKAIPLRFVNLLLDNPITIVDHGIKILIPNPVNFCLHKLVISSRRRKIDKVVKDVQQALYVSAIADKKQLQDLFLSLPRSWRTSIITILGKYDQILPLEIDYIEDLKFTLQSVKS